MNFRSYECCIFGAGPAGLGAALELVKNGITDILIIDKNKLPGGLARTEVFDGVRFDIGPHRFFTKNEEINKLWHDILGRDFKPVSRLTRIFYKGQYFRYPLTPVDVLMKLGFIESLNAMLSFFASQVGKKKKCISFEDWIIQKFGRKLYESFFKTYTEKIWGIPCSQIGAEWAIQRIKGLDTIEVIRHFLPGGKKNKVKTLIEEFNYPILGTGQMYEAMCDRVVAQGAGLMLNSNIVGINRQDATIKSIDIVGPDGEEINLTAKHFFSSVPLSNFYNMLNPPESYRIRKALGALQYRDHITVNLLVVSKKLFSDQWIYVHSPDIQMARLVNYNNFSKEMVSGKEKYAISAEYFVFQNKGLWNNSDDFLKNLAIDELGRMGLVRKSAVEKTSVVRETEAYPTTYVGFQEDYDLLKSRIDQFTNLYSIGRAGMHKYNNQDHSIMSGILAARNYLKLQGTPYNLWDINTEEEYHET